MERLLRMVQSQADVLITHQIWHNVFRVLRVWKEFRSLFYSPPIWLCVVLIFLVWSCVCWGITCIIMTMGIFQRHFWKMIFIPPIKRLQDLPTRR